MTGKLIRPLIIAFMMTAAFTACDSSGDTPVEPVEVTLQIVRPAEASTASIKNEKLTMRNVTTDRTQEFNSLNNVNVLPGLYDMTYEAELEMPSGAVTTLRAAATSVEIKASGPNAISLEGYHNIESDDLIIAEIFFTGTTRSSGNQYNGDNYVKLYNNTDHVVYADGLTLFESKFTTTEKYQHTPDIMSQAMNVQALYTIPGTGKEHPVQPGEYLIICDTGIDHRTANPNSLNLSHADFEWYDESTNPKVTDIDSPTVPNMDKWYCYTKTYWVLHNQGMRAYGIARIPVTKETYLKDYRYHYEYTMVTAAGTFPMSADAYRLPNEWIADVVTTSVEAKYAWNVCAPALDCGWTYCGTIANDKTRYFHSVRRKMLRLNEAGNPVFKDTNNSSADFNPYVTPSEIELQGSATDAAGTPCTTLTYDGITPVKK